AGDQEKAGYLFIAFKPDLFVPLEDYRCALSAELAAIKATPRQEGVAEIRIPGERAHRERERLTREGIEVDRRIHDALTALAVGKRSRREKFEDLFLAARADAMCQPRIFQWFAVTQVGGLAVAVAPGTQDLHLDEATLPTPCHRAVRAWGRGGEAFRAPDLHNLCLGCGSAAQRALGTRSFSRKRDHRNGVMS